MFRRGGFQITWIIALGLALFGVFRYFTSSQKNPVTGEAQRVALSPQQEVALGLRTAPAMAQQMGGLVPDSDPRSRLVDEVGRKLVAQIQADHPWRFDFHLLNDPKTVNAFALPGGQCFITTALFNQLENEAQLAGVMGHEIGHVIQRHSAQRLAKQQLGQSLVSAVAVGASGEGNYSAGQMAQVANQFIQLGYSREQELESDSFGVQYLARAGYDPAEMIHVMEVLKRASGGGSRPEFTSSHPDPGNRAEKIRDMLKQMYPNGPPAGLTKGQSLKAIGTGGAGRSADWGAPATPPARGTGTSKPPVKEKW